MNISPAGIQAIQGYEGLELEAYLDSVKVPTIGTGHTKGVKMGDVITQEQADQFLREDLEDAERDVNVWVQVPLEQYQFDALVSLVFNIGGGAFKGSTLLKVLNRKHYDQAADQFLRWNMAGGRVLLGLTRRRNAERKMFLGLA